ncbi:MAG: tRNA lysidine(34) synthetase TilS [Brevefilum sp.]|nr:tRNA lysidine(34) synthetase TilS [Brevefilum sp.]MDT8382167.1 tRNA lysidine(34) synthetase TilS [Brevefilum sp.]MDW7754932.1 tRNA lysidine(34) synthetase TilS [Brevefilum sp.]
MDDLKFAAIEKCGLKSDRLILVGVSGGADSLALMFGLEILGFQLKIAHLDHSLREASNEDADYIENLAASRGLAFVRKRVDVGKAAEVQGQSIEEAARHIRYKFLFEEARTIGAQAVAVGHHADDQVETVLMHFLRGSALPGLTGMAYKNIIPLWDPSIPLVRPLLGIWRAEIEAFLIELGVEARVDHTNQDVTYFRNRLRHELIPELEAYNPQIRALIWRMSDVLREEDRLLDEQTQTAWKVCLVMQNHNRIILNIARLIMQPPALQRRLLRFAVSLLRPDLRDVGYDAIERGLAFANDPSQNGEIDYVARLNLAKIDDTLIVKTWGSDLPDWDLPLLRSVDLELTVNLQTTAALRHGWSLQARLISEVKPGDLDKANSLDPNEAWLDFDLVEMPLMVRGRQPGDRWQPLGMPDHTQKLKDFFINEKIPEHVRDLWPLVYSGDEIAWVAGLRPSEAFKITSSTQKILYLKLIRKIAQ